MDNAVTPLRPKQKCERSFRMGLLGLVLLFVFPPISIATSIEQKIKVAYIYNFTKFITWPRHSSHTFNICISRNNSFATLFKTLESKTALGMPIKLHKIGHFDHPKNCHIIFFDPLLNNGFITSVYNSGTLIVSENTTANRNEGMINFIVRNGKVKLQINNTYAKQAGLEISAKLLEIAQLVEGNVYD